MIYPLLGFFFVLWVSVKGMVDKYPTEDYIDKVVDGDSDSIDTFTNNIVTSIPDIRCVISNFCYNTFYFNKPTPS